MYKRSFLLSAGVLLTFFCLQGATSSWGQGFVLLVPDAASTRATVLDFANWKGTQGFDVHIVSLSTITRNTPGEDTPARIREYLASHLTSWSIQYLLILGDAKTIPMRYCHPLGPVTSDTGLNANVIPTDLYYADLTGDWDADKDGLYGEFRDDLVDYIPEICVGRIPEPPADPLDRILAKIMAYPSGFGTWRQQILQVAGIQFFAHENACPVLDGLDGAVLQEQVWNDLFKKNEFPFTRFRLYEGEGLSHSAHTYDRPWTSDTLLSEWSTRNPGFVLMASQGSGNAAWRKVWARDTTGKGTPESTPHDRHDFYDEMSWPMGFQTSEIGEADMSFLLNDAYPALVFCAGSSVSSPEFYSLGTGLLRQGAIGFVGASRPVLDLPTWSDKSDRGILSLAYYFADNVFAGRRSFGESLALSLAAYARTRNPLTPADHSTLLLLQFFGDPSLRYSDLWSIKGYKDASLQNASVPVERRMGRDPSVVFASEPGKADGSRPILRESIAQISGSMTVIPDVGLPGALVDMLFEDLAHSETIDVFWDGIYLFTTDRTDSGGNTDTTEHIPQHEISGLHLLEGYPTISADYWATSSFLIRSENRIPSLKASVTSASPAQEITLDLSGFVADELIDIYFNGDYLQTSNSKTDSYGSLSLPFRAPILASAGSDQSIVVVGASAASEGVEWAEFKIDVLALAGPALSVTEDYLAFGRKFHFQAAGLLPSVTATLSIDTRILGDFMPSSKGELTQSITLPLDIQAGSRTLHLVDGLLKEATLEVEVDGDVRVNEGSGVAIPIRAQNLGGEAETISVSVQLDADSGAPQTASSSAKLKPREFTTVSPGFNLIADQNYLLTAQTSATGDVYPSDNTLELAVRVMPVWDADLDGEADPQELFSFGASWTNAYTEQDLLDLIGHWHQSQ